MTPDEARRLLGVGPGATIDEIVSSYRRLQRRHHPDLAGPDDPSATSTSARLNEALSVLRAAVEGGREATAPAAPTPPSPPTEGSPDVRVDSGSLFVGAPADETFLRLLEAGASLGHIGHLDHRLGLLEVLIRPEGGPTCSLLLTLQGRAVGTEVFCEMESIEADPAPPFGPILHALADAVASGTLPTIDAG